MEPESLVSRLRIIGERPYDYGKKVYADALHEAANHIEELEARSSLLVEAGEEFERRSKLYSPDACGEACAAAYTDCADYLRALADRPSPEQTREQDVVEWLRSEEAVEEAALAIDSEAFEDSNHYDAFEKDRNLAHGQARSVLNALASKLETDLKGGGDE